MSGKIINVLYVDDEENNLISFKAAFRKDFNVFTAISAKDAEYILDSNNDIHVLITDQRMPVKTGTELLAEVVKKHPNLTRIILTAFAVGMDIKEFERSGFVDGVIEKPFDKDILAEFIQEGYKLFFRNIAQQQRIFKLKNFDRALDREKKNAKK